VNKTGTNGRLGIKQGNNIVVSDQPKSIINVQNLIDGVDRSDKQPLLPLTLPWKHKRAPHITKCETEIKLFQPLEES